MAASWFERTALGGGGTVQVWYPRDTDTIFGVSNDAEALYSIVAGVYADGPAVWSVSTTGDLGTINGAGVLPITAEQAASATWSVLSGVTRDQASTYQVLSSAQADQAATWDTLAAAASNAVAVWSVVSTLSRDGAALWQVLTTAQQDASPEWTVLGGVYADGSAEYVVETSPLTAANNAMATWDVISGVLADASPEWQVFESVDPADGTAEWQILLAAEADAEALWQVIEQPYADAQALYAIEGVAALVYGTLTYLPYRSEIEQRPHRSELVHTWPQ